MGMYGRGQLGGWRVKDAPLCRVVDLRYLGTYVVSMGSLFSSTRLKLNALNSFLGK